MEIGQGPIGLIRALHFLTRNVVLSDPSDDCIRCGGEFDFLSVVRRAHTSA